MSNKAVLLDRDGVINEDTGYIYRIEDFKILPGVFEALIDLQKQNYQLIIITNQSGINRGYYTEENFKTLTNYMLKEFQKKGITLKKVYHCPHEEEDNCECRKPKPKLALDAISEFNLDPKQSWCIGDRLTDVEMGKRAGLNSILIESEYSKDDNFSPKVKDLGAAVQHILQNE